MRPTRTIAVALLLFVVLHADAAVRVWKHGTNSRNMSDPTNWVGGVVPVEGDTLEFSDLYVINDLPPNTVFRAIHIIDTGGNFEGNPIGLFDGIDVSGKDDFQGTITIFFRANITLFEPATFSSGTYGHLMLEGDVDLNGNALTFGNGGIIEVRGNVTGTGELIVDGPFVHVKSPEPIDAPVTVESGLLSLFRSDHLGHPIHVPHGYLIMTDASTGPIDVGDARIALGQITGTCDGLQLGPDTLADPIIVTGPTPGLRVIGSVDLGNATLDVAVLYPANPVGTENVLVDNDGNDPVIGTFANLPEGSVISSTLTVRPLRVSYVGGDGNDVTLRVYDNSTTFISVSPTPSQVGQSVTITAAVNASGVTGNVDFYSDNTLLGTVPLAGAQAVLATTAIPAGTHVITAKYLGNSQFIESEGSVSHTVLTGPAPVATSTSVTVTPTPSVIGQTVTIIAAVTPVMPMSGQVAFRVDGSLVGTSSVVNGFATFTTNAIPFGAHTITANYAGDSGSLPSNGSVSHAVNNVPPVTATTTVLTVNPDVIVPNAPLLIVATVISNDGVPQGTVTIYDGNDVYAIVPLDAFGNASATIVFRDGPHTLRAVYSGSASHASSSSIDVTVPLGRGKRRAVR